MKLRAYGLGVSATHPPNSSAVTGPSYGTEGWLGDGNETSCVRQKILAYLQRTHQLIEPFHSFVHAYVRTQKKRSH